MLAVSVALRSAEIVEKLSLYAYLRRYFRPKRAVNIFCQYL